MTMKRINFKKLTALSLLIVMLFTMMACTPSTPTGPVDESTTEVQETEAPEVFVDIVKDQKTEYVIVFADGPSQKTFAAITTLKNAINACLGDDYIRTKSDFLKRDETIPEKAKEIVVGSTNRPANAELETKLGVKDYAILFENDRLYIYGKTDASITEAVNYFIEKYIKDGVVSVSDTLFETVAYDYRFATVKLEGTDLFEYKIVIPEKADLSTTYAAANLARYLEEAYGRTLPIVTDKEAETELEILIGKTNRAASTRAYAECKDEHKYVLYKNGKQIVTAGLGYMVGGGAGTLVSQIFGTEKNVDIVLPTEPVAKNYEFKKATSAILMIGDGMADNHIKATLMNGLTEFVPQQLPNKGHAITHSVNYPSVTDSAASATALSSGYKTWNGYLGMNRNKVSKQNVRELAFSKGAKTAVITTDVITGATPGGFLVHVESRKSTAEIQNQINALVKAGKVNYCEGEVGDKFRAKIEEALYGMTDGDDMIFAMFEAALIDKRSHSNDLSGIYQMVTRYNDVTSYVIQYILFHPDTALVITADHECGGVTLNNATGKYYFTSGDHTNANVPVFALGDGTSMFNGKDVDNTQIAKFLASIFDPTAKFGE